VGSNHALYTELVVVIVVVVVVVVVAVQSFENSILLTSQKLANMYLA
jgi:Tfp pilus assembly protein PilE